MDQSISSPTRVASALLAPLLLTDGAIETRLNYEFHLPSPDFAAFLALFNLEGRRALDTIYRSYLEVAAEFHLPMQIGTPTWRAHPEGLARQHLTGSAELERVNREAVSFLQNLRSVYQLKATVAIAGVIGPRRDGYDPSGAPSAAEAKAYHAPQVAVLANAGVDLLYAPTFASAEELLGVAHAMAATGLPYALAPVIDQHGKLLDGTSLQAAVARIDTEVHPAPIHYMIGCVHPTRLRTAHATASWPLPPQAARIAGLKANASTLPPDQLNQLDHLDAGNPQRFAEEMLGLHRDFKLRVLGGCCGTDHRHIRALARQLSAKS